MEKQRKIVSVIITTKNEQDVIEKLLRSIVNQTFKFFEIIVVDNNSLDKTLIIAEKYTSKIFTFGPERSAQRNFGVKQAKSQYILILDADMILTKNVINDCVKKMEMNNSAGALVIPEKSFGIGFWAKCKAFEREFYIGDENIEAARFFRKSLFLKFNGYDETITGPEDWDLPLRMKKQGIKIGRIKSFILHNEKKFSPLKSARKKFYYALHAKEYLKKHPEMIFTQGNLFFRPSFYRQGFKLLKNPALTVGMLYIKFLEMIAALFGLAIGFLKN